MNKEAKPINWAYVAGFTDGDGCIRVVKRPSPPYRAGKIDYWVQWSQRADKSWVLDEIKDFLEERGMRVNDRVQKNHGGFKPERSQRQLVLHRKGDVRTAIVRMLPYLRAKRMAALDALEIIDRPLYENRKVRN